MRRCFFTFILVLGAILVLAHPVAAKSKKHSHSPRRPPPKISVSYDPRMQAATKIVSARARRHSRRLCWRAVKNALVKAKVVSSRPTTRYAKQAGRELQRKYAFKKIPVKNPYKAPLGAILVYGGRGAGHVEIRTRKGFVSDFTNTRPSKRPLIGVYVTPKMMASNRGKSGKRSI